MVIIPWFTPGCKRRKNCKKSEIFSQKMVDELIALGIKGFWNFTHYDIAVNHPEVRVENVHLSDSLMTLRYHIKEID